MTKTPLLEIRDLRTHFHTPYGVIRAVEDVSLSVLKGEAIGIVGESGCGKTVLARSIMRLIPNPPGRIVSGKIELEGRNLLELSEKEMQGVRGRLVAMIFQEPMTSLNPVYTVGAQLAEVFRKHQGLTKRDALEKAVDMLRMVRMPSPESRIRDYPFQMSGGMRQRVIIAMALVCRPQLILADEPTTALDVTIQAQILQLLEELVQELGTSVILITHDLGVVAQTVRRVLVMYAGRVVEAATVGQLFDHPLHPYTEGLMGSMPSLDEGQHKDAVSLKEIPGTVPELHRLPKGCYFYPRCDRGKEMCSKMAPDLIQVQSGHCVRCWLYA
jgi:oligopeptide/dipeptide ABC transporter ATP-binding protein